MKCIKINKLKAMVVLSFFCIVLVFAGDTVRPGLEGLEYRMPDAVESDFLNAFAKPFMDGMDVTDALTDWFDGQLLLTQDKKKDASVKFVSAKSKLSDLKPLPIAPFDPIPDATFKKIASLNLKSYPDVEIQVVEWNVGKLKQYGLLLKKTKIDTNAKCPLILYCHGAAFGVPTGFLSFLADLVRQGYVVIAPAMRGEMLFQMPVRINGEELKCEGEIENLDGEVDDCLAMVSAAWKLQYVRPNEYAMLGHSFGSGVGLLTAARAGAKAKAVVSYDAWLVNPQRYCWDRMRRAARNWDSWEDFCNQPVHDQLIGLVKRSVILHADTIECPMLLFMGGAYDGSVFHLSHHDFTARLNALHKQYEYVLVPNGGHNFVLYQKQAPAKFALQKQTEFLQKYYPAK